MTPPTRGAPARAADVELDGDIGDDRDEVDDARDAPLDGAGDAPPDTDEPDGVGASEPSGPKAGVEPWSWHAIRVSGLFLSVLIPIHFAVTIIGGDVGDTDAATMYNRLRNTWWRGTEWIVIGLSLLHAVLAIHAAINRSDLGGAARRRLAVATTAIGALLSLIHI